MNKHGVTWQLIQNEYYINKIGAEQDGKIEPPSAMRTTELRDRFVSINKLKKSVCSYRPRWVKTVTLESRRLMRVKCTDDFNTALTKFAALTRMGSHFEDHSKLFVCNGKYVYITQPYDMTLTMYEQIKDIFESEGLQVKISTEDAWHYPGFTPLVIVSQTDVIISEDAQL